jgi:hypothetical protein
MTPGGVHAGSPEASSGPGPLAGLARLPAFLELANVTTAAAVRIMKRKERTNRDFMMVYLGVGMAVEN